MKAPVPVILSGLLCLSLQPGVNAAGNSAYLNGKPFAQLNARIDENTAEIDANFDAINQSNHDLEALEERVRALEEGGGGEPPVVEQVRYVGHFVWTTVASDLARSDWEIFRAAATGDFSSIQIRGSLGAGVSCADGGIATRLAQALNLGVTLTEECEGRIWNVGNTIRSKGDSELNAGSYAETATCNRQQATVRPGSRDNNWGGIGFSCNPDAPSQTLEVILTR